MIHPLRQIIQAIKGDASVVTVCVSPEILAPISETQPCGDSLEYDSEYAVLAARLVPKADVQYGKFASQPAPPDWPEIERDSRRLLLRSKDISVLIWFTRARTRMAGAVGLLEGLSALQALLQAFPDRIHPQLVVEGELDPAVRANALAALCDPEGLLDDVREVVVSGSTAFRLTMRDIERAFAVPRPPYAPEAEAVKRQLADMHARGDSVLEALLACGVCVQALGQWSLDNLGQDAPELNPLLKLMRHVASFAQATSSTLKVAAEPVHGIQAAHLQGMQHSGSLVQLSALPQSEPQANWQELPAVTPASLSIADQRAHIRSLMNQVRTWIEHNEPSSPVAVLLKQAERMWGKRFAEVADAIPPELLRAWDKD